MGAIATAFVRVNPELSGFATKLRASAAKEGDAAGKSLSGGIRSHLSTLGKAGALGAITGLGVVFKTGFGEVADYQMGLAQLQQGLKTTGDAAGLSAPQLEDLASKIQDYSGQTDDSIVSAEQLLLTFTNIRNQAGKNNDVFTQTTKIAADMAARLGGDASSSAIQLGKALNDPVKGVTALTRVGVSFTEGQKKSIKSLVDHGQTLKAQKVILAELNKEFGGSAKAVGDTLPGQLAKGKRQFEDLSQTIVAKLLPALTGSVRFLNENKGVLLPLAGAVITLVAAYKTYTIVAKIAAVAQKLLNGELRANPIGLAVTALAALAVGLIYAYKHSEKFRAVVHAAMHAAVAAIRDVVVAFHAVVGAVGAVIGWVRGHWPLLLAILTGPVGVAVLFITRHFDQIVGFVTRLPGRIGHAAAGMWDGIKDAFRSAIDFIIDGWNSLEFKIPGFKFHGIGVPGFTLGVPDIPRLAHGGIVPATPGGRLVLAGEAGRDERVTPLGRDGMSKGEREMVAAVGRLEQQVANLGAEVRGAQHKATVRTWR